MGEKISEQGAIILQCSVTVWLDSREWNLHICFGLSLWLIRHFG